MTDILARRRRETLMIRMGFASCVCGILFLFIAPLIHDSGPPPIIPRFAVAKVRPAVTSDATAPADVALVSSRPSLRSVAAARPSE